MAVEGEDGALVCAAQPRDKTRAVAISANSVVIGIGLYSRTEFTAGESGAFQIGARLEMNAEN